MERKNNSIIAKSICLTNLSFFIISIILWPFLFFPCFLCTSSFWFDWWMLLGLKKCITWWKKVFTQMLGNCHNFYFYLYFLVSKTESWNAKWFNFLLSIRIQFIFWPFFLSLSLLLHQLRLVLWLNKFQINFSLWFENVCVDISKFG